MFGRKEKISRKEKIRVEIIGGYLPKKRMCDIVGNEVIIKPANQGRGGEEYRAKFDNTCLLPYTTGLLFLKSVKHKLLVKEGATECISFGNLETSLAPSCTIQDVNRYATATVIRAAGSLKPENKTLIYVLIIINIILTLFGLLVASGNIKL